MTAVASHRSAGWREAPAARQTVRTYHERTKHRWQAYAAGPETLDWESQPAQFRRFDGAPATPLSAPAEDAISKSMGRPFSELFAPWAPVTPSLASIGAFLQLSLGITAWKSLGPDRWAVRANPSSGNLHPVEAYLVLNGLPALPTGLYHYRPEDHALEHRARFELADMPSPVVWIALTTVVWREAWKYGERAFRYCQLDTGHAVAALQHAAAVLGWRLSEQPQVGTGTLASALGLERPEDFPVRRRADTEREEAELLMAVSWDGEAPSAVDPQDLLRTARTAQWNGVASTIDGRPMYCWPVLNDIAMATRTVDRAPLPPPRPDPPRAPMPLRAASARSAADVILGRRSAQRFDSRYSLNRDDFLGLLEVVTPYALAPWKVLARTFRVDLVLLVHRVTGLDSGLYLLTRPLLDSPSLATPLACNFELRAVAGTPPSLDLRLIASFDTRALARVARGLHCHQEIASQACFALGMVAEFDSVIEQDPGSYRALHREAGLLGHVLYLEAETRGLRGTGIGCFFDDTLHELLKLRDAQCQTLYHFAVGKPIDDSRIESTPCGPTVRTANEKEKLT
jgi:SagB-type dehydrogenase family enzyme